MNLRQPKTSQRGQIMIGFYIALIVILGMVLVALQYSDTVRGEMTSRQYSALALDAARRGFEEGLSFYRRNPNGVAVNAANKPSSQVWSNPPWPYWPDDGFQPQAGDSDFNLTVTTASGSTCQAAIIRDYPVHLSRTTATGGELVKSAVWARYVVKRQPSRNWSPGSNTYNVFTDPDAAHDVTAYRDFSNSAALGSGNYWSLVSRGYVYQGTGSNVPGVSEDITIGASCVLNTITSTPRATYNGRKLLLGSAKVYGELFRIVFSMPQAALFASDSSQITGNSTGVVNGTAFTGVATVNGACPGGISIAGTTTCGPWSVAPSVSSVFPGLDKSKLQSMSSVIMNSVSFTGDQDILPDYNQSNFTDRVARTSFYYLKKIGVGKSGVAGAFIFTPTGTYSNYRFQGSGLIFVDGDLSLTAQTITSWAGIIFVDGNCYINGPAELYGTVIATGKVVVQGAINKAFVEYSDDAVNSVKTFLQDFRVDKPSVVVSYN